MVEIGGISGVIRITFSHWKSPRERKLMKVVKIKKKADVWFYIDMPTWETMLALFSLLDNLVQLSLDKCVAVRKCSRGMTCN
jgi:hypothetical protein